jgi:uncharacterized protein (TIGR02285 family)
MLAAGRVDYLLLSPSPIVYLSEVLGLQNQFAMIPLKETPRMGLFAFICPNTEWGHQVIDDINGVLKTARSTPEYRKLLKWYVVPKEQEEEYWKLYEEQVLPVLE